MTNKSVEITEEMIEAGVAALHGAVGYDYNAPGFGGAEEVVIQVYRAMAVLAEPPERGIDF